MTRERKLLVGFGTVCFIAGISLLILGLTSGGGGDDRPHPSATHLTPTPSPTAPPSDAPELTPVPTPPLAEAGYTMVIDKLGVDNVVTVEGLDEDAVPVVPQGDGAADAVVWYNFSARPGTGSNAVFAGHVTWFGAAVFYNLSTLTNGDIILLRADDGTELTYSVGAVFAVDDDDPNALNVMRATPTDIITIITCEGEFVEVPGDPQGGYYKERLVVQANLVSSTGSAGVSAQP